MDLKVVIWLINGKKRKSRGKTGLSKDGSFRLNFQISRTVDIQLSLAFEKEAEMPHILWSDFSRL